MIHWMAHFSRPVNVAAFQRSVYEVMNENPRIDPFVILSGVQKAMEMEEGIRIKFSVMDFRNIKGVTNEVQGLWGRN